MDGILNNFAETCGDLIPARNLIFRIHISFRVVQGDTPSGDLLGPAG